MHCTKLCSLVIIGLIFGNNFVKGSSNSKSHFKFSIEPQAITTSLTETAEFQLFFHGCDEDVAHNFTIHRVADKEIAIIPSIIRINECKNEIFPVEVSSSKPGRFVIQPIIIANNLSDVDDGRLFVQLKVAQYRPLIIISMLIGWTYTVCWTIGDYFQAWTSYRRKSVVGLSFDFLYLNIVGNCCYATFNVVLFCSEFIETEYFRRHPFGLNPVVPNDVGYAVHAVFGNFVLIAQGFIYQNGGKLISTAAKILISGYVLIVGVFCICTIQDQMHWLDFLYILSYVKLSTNLIKYIPQVLMNFRRKSTEGFAISNRLLDLAGGLLSLLQMILNGWNYDDWQSITGSPVKFGLGFVSIFFDAIFMIQHYVCYKPGTGDSK